MIERAEIDGHVAIERLGDVAQRRDQSFRVSLRANHDGETPCLARPLQIMDVNGRLDFLVHPVFTHVADDADDAQQVVVAVHVAVLNRAA